MSNSNTNDQSLVFNGLGTFVTTMLVAGDYVAQGSLTMPMARDGSGSQVVAVVKLNSTTKLTGPAGATGFRVLIPAVAVGDTISVILSSSAAQDQPLNAIKTKVQIYMGDN